MSKKTVWVWDDIFGRGSYEEPRLFLLSDSFRRALLQFTDRLHWESSWTQQPTDEEWSVIDDGIRALMEEETMDVQVTVSPNITVNSGGGDCASPPPWANVPGQCYPVDPYPAQPDGGYTPPPPPPGTTPTEWDIYRCKLANYAWDLGMEWLENASNVTTQLGTVAVILFFLWSLIPGALVALLGGAMLELAAMFASWAAYLEPLDEVFDRAKAYWVNNRQTIVCKFYNSTDARVTRTDIVASFLDDLATYAESRPWWFDEAYEMLDRFSDTILPIGIFLAPFRLIPPSGYEGDINCSICEGTPPIEGDWILDLVIGDPGGIALTQNETEDWAAEGTMSSEGEIGSFHEWRCYLTGYDETSDPETWTHSAIEFTITYDVSAPAGNAAGRELHVGGVNNTNIIDSVENAPGAPASMNGTLTVWIGKPGSTPPESHDLEVVGDSIYDILPMITYKGTGYGLSDTTMEISVTGFTLLT